MAKPLFSNMISATLLHLVGNRGLATVIAALLAGPAFAAKEAPPVPDLKHRNREQAPPRRACASRQGGKVRHWLGAEALRRERGLQSAASEMPKGRAARAESMNRPQGG
jgi:hypothetical protein